MACSSVRWFWEAREILGHYSMEGGKLQRIGKTTNSCGVRARFVAFPIRCSLVVGLNHYAEFVAVTVPIKNWTGASQILSSRDGV